MTLTTALRYLAHGSAAVVLALALPASAQNSKASSEAKQPYPAFTKVDKNGDKKVTWKEAKAAGIPKEEFESADFDNDGELTRIGYRYSLNQTG